MSSQLACLFQQYPSKIPQQPHMDAMFAKDLGHQTASSTALAQQVSRVTWKPPSHTTSWPRNRPPERRKLREPQVERLGGGFGSWHLGVKLCQKSWYDYCEPKKKEKFAFHHFWRHPILDPKISKANFIKISGVLSVLWLPIYQHLKVLALAMFFWILPTLRRFCQLSLVWLPALLWRSPNTVVFGLNLGDRLGNRWDAKMTSLDLKPTGFCWRIRWWV